MYLNMFLQAAPGGGAMMPIMMIGMFAVMYFFMIRPQQKRAKEAKKFADEMASGERIVTTSGIHGTISRVNSDGTIQINTGGNGFLTIERSAISMEMTQAHQKKTAAPAVEAPAKATA